MKQTALVNGGNRSSEAPRSIYDAMYPTLHFAYKLGSPAAAFPSPRFYDMHLITIRIPNGNHITWPWHVIALCHLRSDFPDEIPVVERAIGRMSIQLVESN